MDCFQFKTNLVSFHENRLPGKEQLQFAEHLQSCAVCSKLYHDLASVDEIIASTRKAVPNPFASTRIMQRIEAEFGQPQLRDQPFWLRMIQPATITFTLLAGILIGIYTAKNAIPSEYQPGISGNNHKELKADLFISDFVDEDRILMLNK